MTRVNNMPTKASGIGLTYAPDDLAKGFLRVCAGNGYDHWTVCEVDLSSPSGMAADIAFALEQARDIGYRQAQEDMRRALGVKE